LRSYDGYHEVYHLPNEIALRLNRPWFYAVGCAGTIRKWSWNPKTHKVEGDYFLKLMAENVAEGIRKEFGWLLLYNSQEGIDVKDGKLFATLHTSIARRSIPANKTIFVTANFWCDDFYRKWCEQNSITDRIHILMTNQWEFVTSSVVNHYPDKYIPNHKYPPKHIPRENSMLGIVMARDDIPGNTPNCWEPGGHAFLVKFQLGNVPEYRRKVYHIPNDIALCLNRPWVYAVGCFAAISQWLLNPKTQQVEEDYLLKLMPEAVVEKIQTGSGWLLLHNSMEGIDVRDGRLFQSLHTSLEYRAIPANKAIFTTANFWHDGFYQKWCEQNSIADRMHILSMDQWEFMASSVANNPPEGVMLMDEHQTSRDVLRENHYLCFNRRVRAHRLAVGMYLQQHNLLDKGLVSFPSPEVADFGIEEFRFPSYPWWNASSEDLVMFADSNRQQEFMNALPLFVDVQTMKVNLASNYTSWPYQKSYFSLVNETLLTDGSLFLSEKTYKPIVNFHPFIVVGSQHTLRKLRADGYKTFDLDESYDEESDPFRRMMLALEQVRKLCEMPIAELHEWYWNQRDVLIHNNNHLRERIKTVSNVYSQLEKIIGLE